MGGAKRYEDWTRKTVWPPIATMNVANKLKGEEKRAQLLQIAGEVFAEHGYHGATFREICRRAKVPIASINYHFRDKRSLYLEAFRYAGEKNRERFRSEISPQVKGPVDRLKFTIAFIVRSGFDPNRPRWYSKLISRELSEPTGVMDVTIEFIRPVIEELKFMAQEILGPGNKEHIARFSAFCIMALLGFFQENQRMIPQIYPDERFDPPAIELLVELLTRFLIAGIESLNEPM